ncbi:MULTISPECIES: biotin--[acetyl-CoA-carboxylase] ligase [unclassified Sphingomonas]|uniref:biotin--[acetyl-CoA-carboxylase] ligase n=1 Tax=unclassified Sphingomonas TaxID=196159 RepID=UPI000E101D70|nr:MULTISPECIES: biotin--[acetyl-CoA-carboxylase] ligase [unclassified Sphingomonas]AXJ96711.1 biotin--[acetyl-CoA-carboxylase] ligase [Sphingomonas sp. FARSPH]
MTIRTIVETGSTNADQLHLATLGAREGEWLRAERQTAGRGRQGRAWQSPPGNLYASTLVRLRPTDPPPASLALVAAVALHETLDLYLPGRAMLKWPNDVLIDGAKLSGILLERSGEALVVGIGVNVAHHPDLPDRATTSLAAAGCVIDAATLVGVLAEVFARWLEIWRVQGFAAVRAAWLAAAHPVGSALSVHMPDGHRAEGLFEGLDADGALVLRLADGTRRVMHAGDVFLS